MKTGFGNAIVGWMSIEGLLTGISITLVLLLIAVLLITFGSLNVNNKKDPNYTKIQVPKKSTRAICKRYNQVTGDCKKETYASMYDTSACTNMASLTEVNGNAGTFEYEQHNVTKACRKPKMTKNASVILIVLGVIAFLSALAAAYITSHEEYRMIFAIGGSGRSGSNNSGSMFTGVGDLIKNLTN